MGVSSVAYCRTGLFVSFLAGQSDQTKAHEKGRAGLPE